MLDIEETLEIFDIEEDEELKKAIEECDKSIASILNTMKNPNPIKKKKVPKKENKSKTKISTSAKRNAWNEYVKEVKNELDSKSDSPVSFAKAISEASRRRNLEKNTEKLNKLRNVKVNNNRKSRKESEEIDLTEDKEPIKPIEVIPIKIKTLPQTLPIEPDVKPTYTYRFVNNEKFFGMSRYVYESYKNCLCVSIIDYMNNYTKHLNFSWVSSKFFTEDTYKAKFTDNVKLFINCWFHKYFSVVYDLAYKEKIVDFNFEFLDNFPISDLEYIITFLNVITKLQKDDFPTLEIIDVGCVIEKK